jgi:hypothetical protein
MVYGILFVDALIFVAGLVVGWMVLPRPQWVENLWHKTFG